MTNELASAGAFLRRQFPRGGRVLCAVSGGLDSMCLLHFLLARPGFAVAAAHFHHQLRGPSADRDQRFVEDWCRGRGVPCFTGTGDTRACAAERGMSVEEAARELRYAFLERTAAAEGFCDGILTAHHADDNAETMLLNLVRGTGAAGLAGIPPVRGIVCRPFLEIPRADLAAYAAAHGVPHVEDETNRGDDAARNLLRHRVFPVLRELNPRAVEHMSAAAGVLARENEVLERLAASLLQEITQAEDGRSIAAAPLLAAPRPVAERAALQWLAHGAGARRDLTAAHVAAVLDLADRGREGARTDLPYGLTALRRGGRLELARRTAPEAVSLAPGVPCRWGDYTLTLLDRPAGEGLALCPGPEPVTAGPCPPGARLTLPGARGPRTVKRLCVDRRIPTPERDRLPALFAGGRLAAVWRLGTDIAFLPEGKARRFVQIIKETEERDHEK